MPTKSSAANRPPGPDGRPFLGSLHEFRRNPTGFLERIARQFGDVVYLRLGPERAYFINHPDAIADILVTHQDHFKKGRILVLAAIGQRWRLRLEPGYRVETRPLFTLRARHGIRMIAEPRK